jgi:hypothetical protein
MSDHQPPRTPRRIRTDEEGRVPRPNSQRPKRLLLKLALRACERGDAEAAAEALKGVLALPESERAHTPPSRRAVTLAKFASMVGYSTRHVRTLVARGVVPEDAVIGSGRASRILVERALEALRARGKVSSPDSVEEAGAAFIRKRGKLRVVQGGGGDES